MKFRLVLLFAVLVTAGCQSSGELKPVSQIQPGVAEEGSLANEKLIQDTTAGIVSILDNAENIRETQILKFVIQQPVGSPGSRSWREMWIVDTDGVKESFLITFRETGKGAADFEISRMQTDAGT